MQLSDLMSRPTDTQSPNLDFVISQLSDEDKKTFIGEHIKKGIDKAPAKEIAEKLTSVIGQNNTEPAPFQRLNEVVQPEQTPNNRMNVGSGIGQFFKSFGQGATGQAIDMSAPGAGWQNNLGATIGNEFGQSALTSLLYGKKAYNERKPFSTAPKFINTDEDKAKVTSAVNLEIAKRNAGLGNTTTAQREAAKLGIKPSEYKNGSVVDEDKLYSAIAMKAEEGTKREQRLSNQKSFQQSTEIRKEFNNSPLKKEYDTISQFYKSAEKAYGMATANDKKSLIASDQALGVFLAKILDPNSVVMPSELERTPQQAALFNKVQGFLPKLQKGGLGITNEDRKAIIDMAKAVYDVAGERFNEHLDRYESLANEYQLNPKSTLGDVKRHKALASEEAGVSKKAIAVSQKFGF